MKKQNQRIVILGGIILLALCLGGTFVTLGSGLTMWAAVDRVSNRPTATPRFIRRAAAIQTATPVTNVPSPTSAPAATAPPTETPRPSPSATLTSLPTATPLPPSSTPIPPTMTPRPTQSPPTATTAPPDTPVPTYPFEVLETGRFPTNHFDFDVFVAITNDDNKPLGGYRLLGRHSSGLQWDSDVSANDWTVNSGAMHYKAGNVKYSMLQSPGGTWTLQLVDEAGQPVAPPVEFSFDLADPAWYFLLYKQLDQ